MYRGRWLLPTAIALRELTGGEITGVDPYSASEARQTQHAFGERLNHFVETLEWDRIYEEVLQRIESLCLAGHCRLVRTTSEAAASQFPHGSIDLIHIDGNHDREAVESDLRLYLPKLAPGAILVLDDVSWPSVRPAFHMLEGIMERLFELSDRQRLHDRSANDFAVFRKPLSDPPQS